MSKITHSHTYEEMTEDMRPQDLTLRGEGLKFETLEHGGEHLDMMPQAIRLTDVDGRSCIYVPIEVGGKIVKSHGFNLSRQS